MRRVLVAPAVDIDREIYLGVTIDRERQSAGRDGQRGRRHRNRGSRGGYARGDRARGVRCIARRGRLAGARPGLCARTWRAAGDGLCRNPERTDSGLCRVRRIAGGGQPPRRQPGRPALGYRRQAEYRRQRPGPASPTRAIARRRRRGAGGGPRPRGWHQLHQAPTAISAAWSTAPGWQWPPWTW